MKSRIIIYERLNVFTLCLCFINRFFFNEQYFVEFNSLLKKYFSKPIKGIGLRQIHHVNYLSRGIQPQASKMAIEIGNKVVEENPGLYIPFTRLLCDQRAISLVKRSFAQSLYNETYKYKLLQEFVESVNSDIYYFPVKKCFIMDHIAEYTEKMIMIKWHYLLLVLTDVIKKLSYFLVFTFTPLILLMMLIKEHRIVLKTSNEKSKRKVLFVHISNTLDKSAFKANLHRSMYLFHRNIIQIKDCVHSCFRNPFTTEKELFLIENGGVHYNYQRQKIALYYIIKRLFVDYFRHFFMNFYTLAMYCINFSHCRVILGSVYSIVKFENLLKHIDVKMAFVETESDYQISIFTLLANKKGIKTMTMIHGYGGYCFVDCSRANTIVNYYIVPGNYYNKYLGPNCPYVDKFFAAGNHEIENLQSDNVSSLVQIKKEGKKIVTILAAFYWPFFPDCQKWPLFDESDARTVFLYYWLSFFKWAARQDDLFFVFKGKPECNKGLGQYEHEFLKEVMSEIPQKKYYQNDSINMGDLIAISDCTITVGNSSALYSSLCLGVPSISYDTTMKGYVAAEKYDKYLVARNPDELIKNLRYILDNGLPESLFGEVRKDHQAEGRLDGKTSLRIKELITEVLQDS